MTLKQTIKSSPLLARLAWPIYRELLLQQSRHPSKGRIPVFTEETRLGFTRLGTFGEFQEWSQSHARELSDQRATESALFPSQHRPFSITGICALCDRKTTFRSSFEYPNRSQDGSLIPNFREHLFCAHCGLKNRLRAALHLFVQEFQPRQNQPIYMTEQLGAAFRWIKGRGYAVRERVVFRTVGRSGRLRVESGMKTLVLSPGQMRLLTSF